jgi:putative PEP-CTERM system histidine kinase
MLSSVLAFGAAALSGVVAIAAVCRKWRSMAAWSFFVGMGLLALESALDGTAARSTDQQEVDRLLTLALIVQSLLPGIWLVFSLTFSRGNYRQFLAKWRFTVVALFVIPVGLAVGFSGELIEVLPHLDPEKTWWFRLGVVAKAVEILVLVGAVLVLMNLETTMRAAVGTMRWRIKFLVLGLGVIFGARIYTCSQTLLFSGRSLALADIETTAILIGCVLIGIAYLRSGFAEVDVYPSRAVLSSSITVLLVGAYLFVVGVLAEIVAHLGGIGSFQTQAVLVMLGVTFLAVLFLSDRLRQGIREFVSRHFARPQHDSRRIWTLATRGMASVLDPAGLSAAAARLIAETFEVLAVSIWVVEDGRQHLVPLASTSKPATAEELQGKMCPASEEIRSELAALSNPFDLEKVQGDWAQPLKSLISTQFPRGGNRVCIPLFAGEKWMGVAILADRVNGVSYTVEELDLLKCIGDQLAATLLNLRLTEDLMQSKELEAFQTMSTFFVHDLKNAASSLSLTLRNLPVHFDDPEFRADALRGIGNTVSRIDNMIGRLSALRSKVEPKFEESDLNELVRETIERLEGMPGAELRRDFRPLPKILVDREQIRSVVTNLLLNARDALGAGGWIEVRTVQEGARVVLSIADNGSGMSVQFMRESLFRPFQSTKKKGLGIGMFQSKSIVEAHGGDIRVESETGKGTTFRVSLRIGSKA